MYTYDQYQAFWNAFPLNQQLPFQNYNEYVKRMIYFQDYLDLFIGRPTFNRIVLNEMFLVQINGNPVLEQMGIDLTNELVVEVDGRHYLTLEYDYPWNNEELCPQESRKLRFVMIGECPRPANTFIYNIMGNYTPWLDNPYKAFVDVDVALPTRRDKLLTLATHGFILVDFIPFALSLTTQNRLHLVQNGYHHARWHVAMDELTGVIENVHHDVEIVLAFSGPSTIHEAIVTALNQANLHLPEFLICHLEHNHVQLNGDIQILNWAYEISVNQHVPTFRCCCHNPNNQVLGPHPVFIKNAFNL